MINQLAECYVCCALYYASTFSQIFFLLRAIGATSRSVTFTFGWRSNKMSAISLQNKHVFGLRLQEAGATIDWTILNFSRCATYSNSTAMGTNEVRTGNPDYRGNVYEYRWKLNLTGVSGGKTDKGEVSFCLQGRRSDSSAAQSGTNLPLRWKFR